MGVRFQKYSKLMEAVNQYEVGELNEQQNELVVAGASSFVFRELQKVIAV
jgi:hypothetical protein